MGHKKLVFCLNYEDLTFRRSFVRMRCYATLSDEGLSLKTGMDADYNYESEEDVDYSKMDMGNKKGPIKRWDFETEEEYNVYMEHREALPKAAFQFGIKMNEGRKTRRTGPKDEKAKLDRDWNKISQIISKRKSDGGGDHGKSREKHESKRSKVY